MSVNQFTLSKDYEMNSTRKFLSKDVGNRLDEILVLVLACDWHMYACSDTELFIWNIPFHIYDIINDIW